MQIELIGCTGAGKSTLAQGILQTCREQGMNASLGDDFVLQRVGLNRVKAGLARTLLVDLCSLFACLSTWRSNHEFCIFSIRIILRLPRSVPWPDKLNLVRNVLKKIGIYEIIRRRSSDREVVLVDEGTLQAAHNLFVHVSVPANGSDLAAFARIVPLPVIAVYVTQDESVLIARTLRRGHKRIPSGSRADVERFIKRAVETFERLDQHLVLERGFLALDGKRNIVFRKDDANSPFLGPVLNILSARLAAGPANSSTATVRDTSHEQGKTLRMGIGSE